MKESFGNWLIVFSIIIFLSLLFTFLFPPERVEEEVLGVTNFENYSIPHIVSIPKEVISIFEEYHYEVEVSDINVEEEFIEITLTEGPIWMSLENNIVRGFPEEEGTYKFVITASNGVNSTSQVNYILVEGYE